MELYDEEGEGRGEDRALKWEGVISLMDTLDYSYLAEVNHHNVQLPRRLSELIMMQI